MSALELLSPAGSYESLIAAVQSGADAVYLGGTKFGARQSASNFDVPEMKKWIDYCHLYGVNVYVTVNTLIKDSEIRELEKYIKDLNNINVDGVIVQDFGVLSVIRAVAPELQVHGSTQMTATSLEDVKFLENLGFTRVVLARELSSEQIRHIASNTECEIEVFVHGALCMSYSGQCLMSSILGGRSGNRGRCAQPCRLPYTLESGNKPVSGFLLSPRDLCLVNHLNMLKNAGVASLKIEGRLKRAGYVSTVVGIYRKCIDENIRANGEDMKALSDAFGRGFTSGFFGGEAGKRMMNSENSSNAAENIFSKEALDRCLEDASFRKVGVSIKATAHLGEPLYAVMEDCDGNLVTCVSEVLCEKAQKSPMSADRIKESLLKFGGSPYKCCSVEVSADEGIIIPVSAINGVRRSLVEEMNNKRVFRNKKQTYTLPEKEFVRKNKKIEIYCEVTTTEQLNAVKRFGINNIIAPENVGAPIIKEPLVSSSGIVRGKRVCVSSVGQIENSDAFEIIGGHRLNITNSYSADFYSMYMNRAILSPELSLKEIISVTSGTDLECGVIAYGRLDLMLCANCPIKAAGKCTKGATISFLKDRKGEKFPVICSDNCSARILNSKPMYMADKWQDIENSGAGFAVLVFTTETERETEDVLTEYIRASEGKNAKSMKENTFTRGHFYRGVL